MACQVLTVEKSVINKVSSLGGLPILSDMYVSLNMPSPEEEWLKITSYAEYLGLDYVRERISPFTAIIVVCDDKGEITILVAVYLYQQIIY